MSEFEGFRYPQDVGFTRLSNDFLESVLARIDNLAELKVILYTMRHTWFHVATAPRMFTTKPTTPSASACFIGRFGARLAAM